MAGRRKRWLSRHCRLVYVTYRKVSAAVCVCLQEAGWYRGKNYRPFAHLRKGIFLCLKSTETCKLQIRSDVEKRHEISLGGCAGLQT